jgi:hypothetical protein
MSPRTHRIALQAVIALAGLVPVGAGLAGVLLGPGFAGSVHGATGASLDSHFRYLSGLLLAIGLLFWSAIPRIEHRGPLVRALTLVVVVGGLGRLASLAAVGPPDGGMRFGMVMELVVTPLICLWQTRVAHGFAAPWKQAADARPLSRDAPLV